MDRNKIRILFLPPVDKANTNAQSLNTREVALRLDPERFEVTLFYEEEPDPRLRNCRNIRLLALPHRVKTIRILKEQLSDYDIVSYMDYSPASYIFVHLPRLMRKGTTTVLHAEAPRAQLVNPSILLRVLYDGVFSRCDAHVGITDFVARDLAHNGDREARFILPVGVDCRFFSPPAKREHAVPTVLFVGTLVERKGPQFVVLAAKHFPGANFRLVGAGRNNFERILQKQISDLNLPNVTLEGPRSQYELLAIMRESDVLLLPSRLEGLPKVSLEAAATGLPCIVFRDYETPSVVDGVTGFQVSTFEEMLHRLEQLIQGSGLRTRMGSAARHHAKKFDWDIVSKQWNSAFIEIAGSSR